MLVDEGIVYWLNDCRELRTKEGGESVQCSLAFVRGQQGMYCVMVAAGRSKGGLWTLAVMVCTGQRAPRVHAQMHRCKCKCKCRCGSRDEWEAREGAGPFTAPSLPSVSQPTRPKIDHDRLCWVCFQNPLMRLEDSSEFYLELPRSTVHNPCPCPCPFPLLIFYTTKCFSQRTGRHVLLSFCTSNALNPVEVQPRSYGTKVDTAVIMRRITCANTDVLLAGRNSHPTTQAFSYHFPRIQPSKKQRSLWLSLFKMCWYYRVHSIPS